MSSARIIRAYGIQAAGAKAAPVAQGAPPCQQAGELLQPGVEGAVGAGAPCHPGLDGVFAATGAPIGRRRSPRSGGWTPLILDVSVPTVPSGPIPWRRPGRPPRSLSQLMVRQNSGLSRTKFEPLAMRLGVGRWSRRRHPPRRPALLQEPARSGICGSGGVASLVPATLARASTTVTAAARSDPDSARAASATRSRAAASGSRSAPGVS